MPDTLTPQKFCRECEEKRRKETPLAEDALHTPGETIFHKMLQALAIQAGLLQRIVSILDMEFGMPKADPFTFEELAGTTGTVYTSPPVAFTGVLRSAVINGSGNVTVLMNPPVNITGLATKIIGVFNLSGQSHVIAFDHHITIPVGTTFSLSSDAASPSQMSISAWIEPIAMTGSEYFVARR